MKKMVAFFLVFMMLCTTGLSALAEHDYIIRDSDTRRLTYEELWGWDLESLGYILNEIFARHGYVFEAGGTYDRYFRSMPWYTPNDDSNNRRACYPKLNQIEWDNEELIKQVMRDMRAAGTKNKGAKSLWTNYDPFTGELSGFSYIKIPTVQNLPVYAAPSADAWRGANGKASVSTNGSVLTAGWDNGWLLVMYETKTGARVGYVDGSTIKGKVPATDYLAFSNQAASIEKQSTLTDDPISGSSSIMTLKVGDMVTYLGTFFGSRAWAYVETTYNGQPVRGFVPAENLFVDVQEENAIGDVVG